MSIQLLGRREFLTPVTLALGGQVIPALNLRARFGFPREPHTPRTRLIFLRHEQRTVALIVDSAREFRTIAPDAIRPIEQTLTGVQGNYLRGVASVGDRLVLLLDVSAILSVEPAAASSAPAAITTSA